MNICNKKQSRNDEKDSEVFLIHYLQCETNFSIFNIANLDMKIFTQVRPNKMFYQYKKLNWNFILDALFYHWKCCLSSPVSHNRS